MSFVELPFTSPTKTMKHYSWVLGARADEWRSTGKSHLEPFRQRFITLSICQSSSLHFKKWFFSVTRWFVMYHDINFSFRNRKELKEAFRLYDKEGEKTWIGAEWLSNSINHGYPFLSSRLGQVAATSRRRPCEKSWQPSTTNWRTTSWTVRGTLMAARRD